MLKTIRYRLLMAKLRKEIAATVRERTESPCETEIILKSSCKVCRSIV